MITKIKTRMASEQGFTLIELLVVMIILGILVAIAVPAYLSFTATAHTSAAEANVRSAIPAAESLYENTGSYATMTPAALVAIAPGVKVDHAVSESTGAGYCLDASSGTTSYYYAGGSWTPTTGVIGTITAGTCAANVS